MLITPRRGEPIITPDGFPTTRFFEYLDGNTSQVNETTPTTEINAESINLSSSSLAKLSSRITELENQIGINLKDTNKNKEIEDLEIISNMQFSGILDDLQKQINELRTLVN